MYFIINDSDKSVNWAGNTAPWAPMVHEGTYSIQLPVDHLPSNTDFIMCFHDPEANTIIENTMGLQQIAEAEALEIVNQQVALQEAISSAEGQKYDELVGKLMTIFGDDPRIVEILSDETITVDEFETINSMLNGESANT